MFKSYKDIIKNTFERRRSKNPSYSLRAFARDLGISSSRISEILNSKQGLSLAAAKKMSQKLCLSNIQADLFCELVTLEHNRNPKKQMEARHRIYFLQTQLKVHQIHADSFDMISTWYHIPLLELTHLDNFQSDPAWIAQKLGISLWEAIDAIERLEHLGFLRNENGRWISTTPTTRSQSSPEKRSEGLKKYHLQLLEQAAAEIKKPLSINRDVSSLVVSIPVEQIDEFKKYLSEFRRSLAKKCDEESSKNQVYCLSMQFFPLTDRR